MQATDLGRYLLYGRDRRLPRDLRRRGPPGGEARATPPTGPSTRPAARSRSSTSTRAARSRSTPAALWSRAGAGRRRAVRVSSRGERLPGVPRGRGRRRGRPAPARRRYGEVSGLIDGHMHGMAYEFLGGKRPLRPAVALASAPPTRCATAPTTRPATAARRCSRTSSTATRRAATTRSAGRPSGTGPTYESLTHEQSYWRWLERAWRGGLRVYVNLFVENRSPLRGLSLQAEQLQRDGQRLLAGAADPRDAGLHRRAVRRSRARASSGSSATRSGAQGDQPGQARGGPGDGGLGALRLRPGERLPRLRQRRRSTPGSTASTRSGCASSRSRTSSTTRSPASPATTARPGRSSTAPTSSPPASSGT